MAIPPQALALENAHVGPNGQPTLAEAFELLSDQWGAGDRDRELALHLLFISWYGLVEPEHITGFQGDEDTTSMLRVAFNDVYQYVAKGIERDPEMLYVVGLMANLAPWALGDANEWESRSEHITGFQGDEDTTSMLRVAFNDVYQYVAKGIERDPEMLINVIESD